MKEIQVNDLDGTEVERLNLEEEHKKMAWVAKDKLTDERLINALNFLASYYTYHLVDEEDKKDE